MNKIIEAGTENRITSKRYDFYLYLLINYKINKKSSLLGGCSISINFSNGQV